MSKTEQKIDYELIDHGIEGAQYFQGCGTSFTKFNQCATGYGSNFAEALNDCLDQIAGMTETLPYKKVGLAEAIEEQIREDEGYVGKDWPTEPNTEQYHEENEDSEMYYYVSICYSLPVA